MTQNEILAMRLKMMLASAVNISDQMHHTVKCELKKYYSEKL